MPTSIPLQLSRVTLLGLAGLGFFTLQLTSRTNNLFTRMEHYQSKLYLSDGVTSYSPEFTGVQAVDDVMGFVLQFFWPIIDGKNPALSLCSFAFGGQGVAAWVLMMVEGRRRGGGWRAVSFTAVFGIFAQLLGLGMVGPLYLLLHSFNANLALTPDPSTLSPSTISSIASIPAAVTIAYIGPMLAMALHSPAPITLEHKLLAHNIWQVFPFTAALTHGFLYMIWPYSPAPTPRNTLRYLRFTYKFALSFAVPVHIASLTLSTSAYLFPTMFTYTFAAAFQPENVFVPSLAPFEGRKISSVAEGAMWFIQWDYALVGAAYLVWGVMLRQLGRRVVMDAEGFGVAGLLKVATRVVVLGPVGAAVVYVWERDEAVLGRVDSVKKIQ